MQSGRSAKSDNALILKKLKGICLWEAEKWVKCLNKSWSNEGPETKKFAPASHSHQQSVNQLSAVAIVSDQNSWELSSLLLFPSASCDQESQQLQKLWE